VIQECINPIAIGGFDGFMHPTGHEAGSNIKRVVLLFTQVRAFTAQIVNAGKK
jgi:hypothetical protein